MEEECFEDDSDSDGNVWVWADGGGTKDECRELLDIDFLRVRKLQRLSPRLHSPTPPLPPSRVLG